jgi:hypothetical protein
MLMSVFCVDVYAKDYSAQDNGEVEVVISRENVNRFKIFHDRIKDIRANPDELTIETDRVSGELFLRPAFGRNNIDAFIKTEKGFTYKIVFKVRDLPAQQIFINRNDFTLQNYADADILRREKLKLIDENLYFDFQDNYKLSAINLIRAMSSGVNLREFTHVDRDSRRILNYRDFKVEWLFSYIKSDKSGISGEIARITNISRGKIELAEDMFFRNGIRAVRLEKMELGPNESALLYFVGGGA